MPLFDWVDVAPLLTGLTVASLLVFSRWQNRASLECAPALGALLTALSMRSPFMLVLDGDPLRTLFTGLEPPFWLALVGSAVGSAVYDSALVIAPRLLTSAEVALILLLETVFGPLWVGWGTEICPTRGPRGRLVPTAHAHWARGGRHARHGPAERGGLARGVAVRRRLDIRGGVWCSARRRNEPLLLANIGAHRSPLYERSAAARQRARRRSTRRKQQPLLRTPSQSEIEAQGERPDREKSEGELRGGAGSCLLRGDLWHALVSSISSHLSLRCACRCRESMLRCVESYA